MNKNHSGSWADLVPCERSAKIEDSVFPSIGGFIEITITYPHNLKYLRLNSEKQKLLLAAIFRNVICAIPNILHFNSQYEFEYTKTGQIHLHGFLELTNSAKVYSIGVVSDMAKALQASMPKKYNKFQECCLYTQYCRYKSHQGVIQYRATDDEHIPIWRSYIVKCK